MDIGDTSHHLTLMNGIAKIFTRHVAAYLPNWERKKWRDKNKEKNSGYALEYLIFYPKKRNEKKEKRALIYGQFSFGHFMLTRKSMTVSVQPRSLCVRIWH